MTHEDFDGHKGTIGAGDLQWMTAGRGVVHSEMPAAEGTQKGLQLWINLSSQHKMQVYSFSLSCLRFFIRCPILFSSEYYSNISIGL